MAQFVQTPPIEVVREIFSEATGRTLLAGAAWKETAIVTPVLLAKIRPYIRPCHRRLLDEASSEPSVPFLRQILRPHGFRVRKERGYLRLVSDEGVRAAHGPGGVISWD
jgi:hypothetical protein